MPPLPSTDHLPVIPAGHIFIITFGDRRHPLTDGVFRALREIDLPVLVNQWCNIVGGPGRDPSKKFWSYTFLRWVVFQGYLEQVPAFDWYVGDDLCDQYAMHVQMIGEPNLARGPRTRKNAAALQTFTDMVVSAAERNGAADH